MAFRKVDGKLARVDGKFSFRDEKSITMTVSDEGFPITNYSTVSSIFEIVSEKPIFLTLTTNEQVFNFSSSNILGNNYVLKIGKGQGVTPGTYAPVSFINSLGVTKIISIEFQNPKSVKSIQCSYFDIYGKFPELNLFRILGSFGINQTDFVTSFPEKLSDLFFLNSIRLSNIGLKHNKIPDSFFNLNITTFHAHNTFNLSDPISSNAFKINQWSNLQRLDLSFCGLVDYFPNDWASFSNSLLYLRMNGNNYSSLPSILESFNNIDQFFFVINSSQREPWIDLSNWKNTRYFQALGNLRIDNLENDWINLYSLIAIYDFNQFVQNNSDFDIFIDSFYTLCTTNGSITNNSGQFPTYPNRFRNISWGHGSLSFTGTKQAPAGYIQGVSNGNAITPGEKVYVLQNQMGHLIDHAI